MLPLNFFPMFFPEIALKLQVPMATSGKTAYWLQVKFCYDCSLDNKQMVLKAWPKETPAVAHGQSHILLKLRGWKRWLILWCQPMWSAWRKEGKCNVIATHVTIRHTGQGAFNICLRQEIRVRCPPRVSVTPVKLTGDNLLSMEVTCNVPSRPNGEITRPGVEAWEVAKEKGQYNLNKNHIPF